MRATHVHNLGTCFGGRDLTLPPMIIKIREALKKSQYTVGDRRDLNPQPPVPQTGALPIELRPPMRR